MQEEDDETEVTDFSISASDPEFIKNVLQMGPIHMLDWINKLSEAELISYCKRVAGEKNLSRLSLITRIFIPKLRQVEAESIC